MNLYKYDKQVTTQKKYKLYDNNMKKFLNMTRVTFILT